MLNLLLIILTWASFGLVFALGKVALTYSSPLQFLILRMFLGGTILIFASPDKSIKVLISNIGLFFRVALFHIYLAFVFEYWALSHVYALRASMLYSLSPFFTAILSFLIYKEKFNFKKIFGLFLGFFSCLGLMSTKFASTNLLTVNFYDLLLIISIFSSSYAWFEVSKLVNKKISLVFINGVSMLLGSLLCFITKLFVEPDLSLLPSLINFDSYIYFFVALVGTVIFANVLGYNLYGYLFEKIGPTKTSLTGFLCPFFVIFFSCLLNLNFEFNFFHLGYLALGFLGLYIFNSENKF